LDVVGEQEVRRLLNAPSALALARDTLVGQAAGQSLLSSPSAMSLDAGKLGGPRFKFKAATVAHLKASGIRLLARFGGGTGDDACNHVAVYDHTDGGKLIGLVSELWLSRIRTASFGVAGVEALLPDRPLVIGLFGAGAIADEIVPLMALAFSVKQLKVLSRRRESTLAFVERHNGTLGNRISAAETAKDVVVGSDLIVTLTESKEPLVQPGWLGPQAVLCTMGSHNEVAYDVLAEVDRLVVDDPDYASEMGDGGAWIRAGQLTEIQFRGEIDGLACDYAAAFRDGKRSDGRKTIAIIQGMAIGDVAFAAHVMRAWKNANQTRNPETAGIQRAR
jgi:ornithine cyclodeaminase/alanine dehydrogenase-like protein (mu-crystallin family)